MTIVQQATFLITLGVAAFFVRKRVLAIRANIALGKHEPVGGGASQRWNNVLLLAFGQKKMFKRPLPAILHFFVYAGFVLINIEVLEILIDGIFQGGPHHTFEPLLGGFYNWVIGFFEILAVLTLVAVIAFLIRRNILKVRRLNMHELDGFPRRDANTILYIEIALMT